MIETLETKIYGPIFEIHINNEKALNSFTIPEFVQLAHLFELADNNNETSITLLTSSGNFFSTGANIKYVSKMVHKSKIDYYELITSKNILLVHTILNHKKLIVVALNGPMIGLSAALVCLMDVIYARSPNNENEKPYMQFPFASIGLVNECGVSASLPYRLGLSLSLEAVCMGRKITLDEMVNGGLISKTFKADSTDEFNQLTREHVVKLISSLAIDSIIENKKLNRLSFDQLVNKQIVDESMTGLSRWVDERPQSAFALMANKNKTKLKGKL